VRAYGVEEGGKTGSSGECGGEEGKGTEKWVAQSFGGENQRREEERGG